jgi:hypothetical protein
MEWQLITGKVPSLASAIQARGVETMASEVEDEWRLWLIIIVLAIASIILLRRRA